MNESECVRVEGPGAVVSEMGRSGASFAEEHDGEEEGGGIVALERNGWSDWNECVNAASHRMVVVSFPTRQHRTRPSCCFNIVYV